MTAKFILHIGAHKTGTTTLQRVFSANRETLAEAGIWYPNYSEIFPSKKNHYAHHDLAKGLMGEGNRFNAAEVGEFFELLGQETEKRDWCHTVFLSAEPFLRGKIKGGDGVNPSVQFQKHLSELVSFSDIEVVLVLRNYVDYLESLYSEHLSATRYKNSIYEFKKSFSERFEYRKIIESWEENFGPVKPLVYEKLGNGENLVNNFCSKVFGSRLAIQAGDYNRNLSLPIPLLELKRIANRVISSADHSLILNIIKKLHASRALAEKYEKKFAWMTEEEAETFLSNYKNEIDWLVEKYGGAFLELKNYRKPRAPQFPGWVEKELNTMLNFLSLQAESEQQQK